jgi:broad specificity phosphatase PhoE
VRHAESVANLSQKTHIGGRVSASPLTPKGVEQATRLGKHWQHLQQARGGRQLFDRLYVSPTTRTKTTASIICKHLGINETQMNLQEDLLELTHGEWDGQLRHVHHTPQVLENMALKGWEWKSPAGGESLRDVGTRMTRFINSISELENTDAEEPISILAVSHSIAIRTLLHSLLNCNETLTRRHALENTGVCEFWKYPEGWSLQRWNDHFHLHDPKL